MSSTYKVQIGKQVFTTHVISVVEELENHLRTLLWLAQQDGMKSVVALDVEKEYNSLPGSRPGGIEKVATVMLGCGTTCFIIQLLKMDSTRASCCLSKFLQYVEITFVGIRIRHCLDALERDYGIKCRNALELEQLPRTLSERQWSVEGYTLADIANKVKQMDGFLDVAEVKCVCDAAAFSDWGATKLSQEQIKAATLRTYLCFCASNYLYGGYLK